MKCEKCGNEVKLKDAKFCPFCGAGIDPKEELASYTRGQFFSYTGDAEVREAWEDVRNMSAKETLSWIREHPPAHYVYCFCGNFPNRRNQHISREWVSRMAETGKVGPKKIKLYMNKLPSIGEDVFWTKEECEAAILEEIEKSKSEKEK